MSERNCPLNKADADSSGVIWEPYIPQECWLNCIKRALRDPEVPKTLENYDADEFERLHDGKTLQEVYPEGHDWSREAGIKILPTGQKVFIQESGPEHGGEILYVVSTERVALSCKDTSPKYQCEI